MLPPRVVKTWIKIVLGILAAGAAGIVLSVVAAERLANRMLRDALRELGGFEVEVEKAEVSLLHSRVDLRGLKLLNPPEFEERTALDVPRFYLDYDLLPLLRGNLRIRKLDLDVSRICVVRNADGRINFESLLDSALEESGLEQPAADRASASGVGHAPAAKPGSRPSAEHGGRNAAERKRDESVPAVEDILERIRIDEFSLRVGSTTLVDHDTGGSEPRVVNQRLDIEVRQTNVVDLASALEPVLVRSAVGVLGGVAVGDAVAAESDLSPEEMTQVQQMIADMMAATASAEPATNVLEDPLPEMERLLEEAGRRAE
jgi:hypothetical protein